MTDKATPSLAVMPALNAEAMTKLLWRYCGEEHQRRYFKEFDGVVFVAYPNGNVQGLGALPEWFMRCFPTPTVQLLEREWRYEKERRTQTPDLTLWQRTDHAALHPSGWLIRYDNEVKAYRTENTAAKFTSAETHTNIQAAIDHVGDAVIEMLEYQKQQRQLQKQKAAK